MINLIKADFYKLLRRKAFYICGALAIIFSFLRIVLINYNLESNGIPASLIGYNGFRAVPLAITAGSMFCTILVSMFIAGEFSFGTMKNIISGGQNRINIYLSKLIITLSITAVFVLLCVVTSFTTGSIFWGVGEATRDDYLGLLRMIGLIILVEFSMQCIFAMVGFLSRSTGGTIAINILTGMFVNSLVLPLISFGIYQIFKIENIQIERYWPYTYMQYFVYPEIRPEDLTTGLIVCLSAIVISSAIGIYSFVKRDVK